MTKKIHIRRFNSAAKSTEETWVPGGDKIGIAYCPKPGKFWGDSVVFSTTFDWEFAQRIGVMRLCRDSIRSLKAFAKTAKPDGPFGQTLQ